MLSELTPIRMIEAILIVDTDDGMNRCSRRRSKSDKVRVQFIVELGARVGCLMQIWVRVDII